MNNNTDVLMYDIRKKLVPIEGARPLLRELLDKIEHLEIPLVNQAYSKWQEIEPDKKYFSTDEFKKDYKKVIDIVNTHQ